MVRNQRAVYFFCRDPENDPVAPGVFEASAKLFNLDDTGLEVDSHAVLRFDTGTGKSFYYVRTDDVLSHDYERYLPVLNNHFTDFDFAGLVNWHGGKNAPNAILTVHTTGDVATGNFGLAHPIYTRNLLLAIEGHRKTAGLHGFTTTTEATHWSGIPYGGSPELIPRYPVPLVDIEIGSSPTSWSNSSAIEVVTRSLPKAFDGGDVGGRVRSLLCVGGVHLEASYAEAVLNSRDDYPLAVSHILPKNWVEAGNYDAEAGLAKLQSCVKSIEGGIHGIVFHDDLKGRYKSQLRLLAEQLNVPMFKHRALRQPQTLPIW